MQRVRGSLSDGDAFIPPPPPQGESPLPPPPLQWSSEPYVEELSEPALSIDEEPLAAALSFASPFSRPPSIDTKAVLHNGSSSLPPSVATSCKPMAMHLHCKSSCSDSSNGSFFTSAFIVDNDALTAGKSQPQAPAAGQPPPTASPPPPPIVSLSEIESIGGAARATIAIAPRLTVLSTEGMPIGERGGHGRVRSTAVVNEATEANLRSPPPPGHLNPTPTPAPGPTPTTAPTASSPSTTERSTLASRKRLDSKTLFVDVKHSPRTRAAPRDHLGELRSSDLDHAMDPMAPNVVTPTPLPPPPALSPITQPHRASTPGSSGTRRRELQRSTSIPVSESYHRPSTDSNVPVAPSVPEKSTEVALKASPQSVVSRSAMHEGKETKHVSVPAVKEETPAAPVATVEPVATQRKMAMAMLAAALSKPPSVVVTSSANRVTSQPAAAQKNEKQNVTLSVNVKPAQEKTPPAVVDVLPQARDRSVAIPAKTESPISQPAVTPFTGRDSVHFLLKQDTGTVGASIDSNTTFDAYNRMKDDSNFPSARSVQTAYPSPHPRSNRSDNSENASVSDSSAPSSVRDSHYTSDGPISTASSVSVGSSPFIKSVELDPNPIYAVPPLSIDILTQAAKNHAPSGVLSPPPPPPPFPAEMLAKVDVPVAKGNVSLLAKSLGAALSAGMKNQSTVTAAAVSTSTSDKGKSQDSDHLWLPAQTFKPIVRNGVPAFGPVSHPLALGMNMLCPSGSSSAQSSPSSSPRTKIPSQVLTAFKSLDKVLVRVYINVDMTLSTEAQMAGLDLSVAEDGDKAKQQQMERRLKSDNDPGTQGAAEPTPEEKEKELRRQHSQRKANVFLKREKLESALTEVRENKGKRPVHQNSNNVDCEQRCADHATYITMMVQPDDLMQSVKQKAVQAAKKKHLNVPLDSDCYVLSSTGEYPSLMDEKCTLGDSGKDVLNPTSVQMIEQAIAASNSSESAKHFPHLHHSFTPPMYNHQGAVLINAVDPINKSRATNGFDKNVRATKPTVELQLLLKSVMDEEMGLEELAADQLRSDSKTRKSGAKKSAK